MTEGLHHQIGREAQASQIFQLVTGHRTGSILRANRGHLRFAIGTRTNTGHATGTTNHFLRQGETTGALCDIFRLTEYGAVRQTQRFARFGGQAATDDQRNTATGADFVNQHFGFKFEAGQQVVGFVVADFAFERIDVDDIAHVQVVDVHFNRQCARIFHGVEEDGCNFAAQHHAAAFFIRHVRDVVAHKPQHRVGGGFT